MEICIKWNVCRICLEEENGNVVMIPIFGDAKLPNEIFDCSGIELKQTDNLPEKICKKCLVTLKYALKFRTTCRKSTDYLQSVLLKTQSASSIFKPAKTIEDEAPFESIDFLDEEQPIEIESLGENNVLNYIIEDVDVSPTENENASIKNSEADESQDNEELIYMSESEIKQEVDDEDGEEADDDLQSQSEKLEQIDEFIINEESMTRTSEDEQKVSFRRLGRRPASKNPVEFICDVCGNHFQKRGLLNFHMKIHRNEKNYICEICSKRFNSPCNLRAHIRVHTGEKPFQCQYCERKFADRSTQIKHERIHTNEKPYNCGTCGKAFSLSTSLKAHEKMHTGEKPYKCEPCSKAFTLPHQLKAHLLTNMHRVLVELEQ